MPEPSDAPAPRGSDVTDAGMFTTAQCHQPLWVGASGSKQVMAKLLVSAGNPDHDSCGERSSPPALPCTWVRGSASPSVMSSLVSVKVPTSGRWS